MFSRIHFFRAALAAAFAGLLVACGGGGSGSGGTPSEPPAPQIQSFKATTPMIVAGASTTLTATFTGGTGVVTPGNLPIVSGGSVTVSPTVSQVYTLTVINATGAGMSTEASVTVTSGFRLGAAMVHPRAGHTATLLTDGRILVAGGSVAQVGGATPVLEAELYDPSSHAFQATGSMLLAGSYTATLLSSGKVLFAGVQSAAATPATIAPHAELYDPATGRFTATGAPAQARLAATAVRLANGKVLVTGGVDAAGLPVETSELYDPSAGTFSSAAGLLDTGTAEGRGATAIVLADGRVLVAGSASHDDGVMAVIAPSQAFAADGATVALTGARKAPSGDYLATRLPDGRVLVAGGVPAIPLQAQRNAEIFDPATNTYASTSFLLAPRDGHDRIVTLSSGQALVVGLTSELYDPAGGVFTATGSLAVACSGFTLTALPDGTAVVIGGNSDSVTSVAHAQVFY